MYAVKWAESLKSLGKISENIGLMLNEIYLHKCHQKVKSVYQYFVERVKLNVCCCIMAILLETRTLSTENREVATYIAGYTKRNMPAAMNMPLE